MKVLWACLAVLALVALYAPGFLVYSYPLDKADCVMVIVGPGRRIQGGKELIKEGRVKALLIPAYHQIAFAEGSGLGKRQRVGVTSGIKTRRTIFGRTFRVVENTHLELLLGKAMMDKLAYRSAIIVSSPYHMRRLKLIADKVFGDGDYRIGFGPTPFEKQGILDLPRSWRDFGDVVTEYGKIGWFLIYSRFIGHS